MRSPHTLYQAYTSAKQGEELYVFEIRKTASYRPAT